MRGEATIMAAYFRTNGIVAPVIPRQANSHQVISRSDPRQVESDLYDGLVIFHCRRSRCAHERLCGLFVENRDVIIAGLAPFRKVERHVVKSALEDQRPLAGPLIAAKYQPVPHVGDNVIMCRNHGR